MLKYYNNKDPGIKPGFFIKKLAISKKIFIIIELKTILFIQRQKRGFKRDGFKRLNTFVYNRLKPLFC